MGQGLILYYILNAISPLDVCRCGRYTTFHSIRPAVGTETLAEPQPDGSYRLHGFKWFTSATDADMTLTLGRVVGRDGATSQVLHLRHRRPQTCRLSTGETEIFCKV